ncbi:hypothetical protein Gotur_015311, partial [Gossypium turneri]
FDESEDNEFQKVVSASRLVSWVFLLIKFANGFNLSARENRILCKDKERQAQLELKQSLVDDHGLLSSWGIRDCCHDNDFGGSQFSDFNGSLSRLRYLNIANAGLSWRILNQLGSLSSSNHVGENSWLKLVNKLPIHLENLQLGSCGLHGIILSQPLNGSFASLIRVINVSRNRLTSSSALKWFTNISSNLAELNLEYNNLIQASVLGIFRNMASFKHLYLSKNQLRDGIQGILGNIYILQTLDLSHNNLTGLFPQLPRCIESLLEIFNLDWNSLHGPLPDFTSLTSSKLVVLVLDGNQLTGPLPNFCNNAFMSLEELDISHNKFNGTLTESLRCLSRLKHLLASRNSIEVLEFQTPYLLRYATSPYFYFLNLSNNQISGILPDLLSPNTLFITEMDSSSNMFDGSLPLLPYINVLNLAKNRFTGSLDPFCKITSGRSLKAMVQTYLVSGSPYLELYVQFSSPNKAFVTSTSTAVREEYTTSTRHSVSGRQDTELSVFGGSMEYTTPVRHLETSTRRDDVLPTTSTGEGTSYVTDDSGLDDESDVDPPQEPDPDSVEVVLFSELEPVPTESEDGEEGSDGEKEDPRFTAYSAPAHMHNVNLSADDALEFPDLPHRRCDRTSLSLDSGELEVGKEFSSKDSFLGALK